MATFAGSVEAAGNPITAEFYGRNGDAYAHAPQPDPTVTVDDPLPLDPAAIAAGAFTAVANEPAQGSASFSGALGDRSTPGIDWFEKFHVIDRSYDFGNVLSETTDAMEVFWAGRRTTANWTAFTNNAGDGTTVTTIPTFPQLFYPMSGFDLTITVEVAGQASVDATFDFTFDTGVMLEIPIELSRVVFFPNAPEMPYTESMEFFTDVVQKLDGSEQRFRVRKRPRQAFDWAFSVDDGAIRSRLDNLLFDWQARTFGIPMWHDRSRITAAVSANDTVISVDSTDDRDYRNDPGLVVVYKDETTFDVATLSSFTSSSVTLASGTANAYDVGDLVMPVRLAVAANRISGTTFPVNASTRRIRFRVTDNDVDIADTSAFSSFNSKVLLDDCNGVRQLQESFDRPLLVLDPGSGLTFQDTDQAVSRRVSSKTFLAFGQAAHWDTRQLLHALAGRQVSFYLPTFQEDLTLIENVTGGQAFFRVSNVGYTQHVMTRQPKNVVRFVFNDGSAAVVKTITGSTEDSGTQETLNISDTFASGFNVADVERIEFVEKVRFDSDTIRLQHEVGERMVRFSAPVRTVLE